MEVKLNAEIRNYTESIFFGLNARQFICSLLAVAASVAVYFTIGRYMDATLTGLMCAAAASPFAAVGFIRINGMSADKYALAMLRYFKTPRKLIYKGSSAVFDDLVKRGVICP